MMAGATLTLMLSPGPRPQAKSWLLNYGSIHRWQEPLPIPRMPHPWGPPQIQVRHPMMNLIQSVMHNHLVSSIATLHLRTLQGAMSTGAGGPTKYISLSACHVTMRRLQKLPMLTFLFMRIHLIHVVIHPLSTFLCLSQTHADRHTLSFSSNLWRQEPLPSSRIPYPWRPPRPQTHH